MANVQITQLPTAGALTGTEAVPVVQNGVTVQTTTGAIQATSNLSTYPFLMTQATGALGSSRYITTGAGLTTVDGGAGSTFAVNLTGAPLSLVTSPAGIVVKTDVNTLTSRTIAITGSGLAIANADGIAGNPTISLAGIMANFASVSGTGLLTVNGTVVNQTTITGTANSISVTNGNALGGAPTIAIADNPILTGTAGVQVPSGTTAQRVGVNGVVRYNTSTNRFEGYEGNVWTNFGTGDGTVTTVSGTNNQITVVNGTTSPVISITNNPTLPGTGGVVLPQGATSARYSVNGTLRYNTDTLLLEAYTNNAWGIITTSATVGVTSVATGTGLTGGPITSSGTISIANTTVTAGSYGSATQVGTFTVNAQGQLTASANVTVTPAWTSITSTPTTISGYGITDGVTLTGSQTLTNKVISGASNTLSNIGNSSLTNSTVTVGTTSIALGATSLTLGGLTSVAVTQDPVSALQVATKQYVDAAVSNVNYHAACNYASTADLGTVLYNNGASGVGATITKLTPCATLAIDGANPSVGQRILVKNETSGQYNGIYTVTSVGSGAVGWVLTRATDYDQVGTGTNEIAPGDTTFIISGTVNASTQWVQTTDLPITIGTTSINFVQIAGPGSYTAGTGLTLSGTQFSITNTAVTAGAYGSASSVGTFTVNAQGQLTLAGNTSIAISGSQITSGTVAIANGGTGQTTASGAFNALSPITTTGDLIIGNGTNTATRLPIGTNGYVLTSNGTTATWQASSGGVTSFSAGTTGFTPSTGTTGSITLAGTLNVANGGTGANTLSGVVYGNGTSAFTSATGSQIATAIGTTAVTNATNATNVALTNGSGATNYLHFSSSATGNQATNTNTSITVNATNGTITGGISGGTF